jgi:hypothetical protein
MITAPTKQGLGKGAEQLFRPFHGRPIKEVACVGIGAANDEAVHQSVDGVAAEIERLADGISFPDASVFCLCGARSASLRYL